MPSTPTQPATEGSPEGSENEVSREAIVRPDTNLETATLLVPLAQDVAPNRKPVWLTLSRTPPLVLATRNWGNHIVEEPRLIRQREWVPLHCLQCDRPERYPYEYSPEVPLCWPCYLYRYPDYFDSRPQILRCQDEGDQQVQQFQEGPIQVCCSPWCQDCGEEPAITSCAQCPLDLCASCQWWCSMWWCWETFCSRCRWPATHNCNRSKHSLVATDTLACCRPIAEDYPSVFGPFRHLLEYRVRMSTSPSGWNSVQVALTIARFTTIWTNPLWEIADTSFHRVCSDDRRFLLKCVQEAICHGRCTSQQMLVLVSLRTLLLGAQLGFGRT